MDFEILGSGIVYYVAFLFSTTAHEAAHAWAAKVGGDLTAYHGGQVSLDPSPHIRREPFGMVVLPILSILLSGWPFGFASAPYDPRWAMRHPRRAAWMAAAGPGANLTICLLCAIIIRLGLWAGIFFIPRSFYFEAVVSTHLDGVWPAISFVLSVFFSLNLLLACLNLIPLPPLDGSTVLMLGMRESTANRYQAFLMESHALGMLGLVVAWRLFDVIFGPIFVVAIHLIYPG